ncbi:unnamed protein product [Calicophoron daubneyi]|uniref:WW domain-containing protein n=1 Tax=Calicophoron daubneyi TaxID=300641 RepID=A0AAV2TZ09_CALDB
MDPLPAGWEMRLDESTGRYYFVDHNSKSTQWRHPITQKVYQPAKTAYINGNAEEAIEQTEDDVKQTLSSKNVTDVVRRARLLQPEIDSFEGTQTDKEYLRLMETLERLTLELDAVEHHGQQDIRSMRGAAVREIQQLIGTLEARARKTSSTHKSTNSSESH